MGLWSGRAAQPGCSSWRQGYAAAQFEGSRDDVMEIGENEVGAGPPMVPDHTWEVGPHPIGKEKLLKGFHRQGGQARAELWADLSVTRGERELRGRRVWA